MTPVKQSNLKPTRSASASASLAPQSSQTRPLQSASQSQSQSTSQSHPFPAPQSQPQLHIEPSQTLLLDRTLGRVSWRFRFEYKPGGEEFISDIANLDPVLKKKLLERRGVPPKPTASYDGTSLFGETSVAEDVLAGGCGNENKKGKQEEVDVSMDLDTNCVDGEMARWNHDLGLTDPWWVKPRITPNVGTTPTAIGTVFQPRDTSHLATSTFLDGLSMGSLTRPGQSLRDKGSDVSMVEGMLPQFPTVPCASPLATLPSAELQAIKPPLVIRNDKENGTQEVESNGAAESIIKAPPTPRKKRRGDDAAPHTGPESRQTEARAPAPSPSLPSPIAADDGAITLPTAPLAISAPDAPISIPIAVPPTPSQSFLPFTTTHHDRSPANCYPSSDDESHPRTYPLARRLNPNYSVRNYPLDIMCGYLLPLEVLIPPQSLQLGLRKKVRGGRRRRRREEIEIMKRNREENDVGNKWDGHVSWWADVDEKGGGEEDGLVDFDGDSDSTPATTDGENEGQQIKSQPLFMALGGNWDIKTRDEAIGRGRGWYCYSCGKINQALMMRHKKCTSSWCKVCIPVLKRSTKINRTDPPRPFLGRAFDEGLRPPTFRHPRPTRCPPGHDAVQHGPQRRKWESDDDGVGRWDEDDCLRRG